MRKNSPMPAAMPTLRELQRQVHQAVLGGDTAEIVAAIRGDGLDPAARIGTYRNHFFATLGGLLQRTFPVVCRLVDERFFAYAAHEYVRQHPPRSRCLVEYGADFADFLADFAPCKSLPYLADVARFEWHSISLPACGRRLRCRHKPLPKFQQARLGISCFVCSLRSATSFPPGRSMRSGRRTRRVRYRRSTSRAAAPDSRSAAPATLWPGCGWIRQPSRSEQRSPAGSCSPPP